jgi:hypothetical protein
MRWIGVSLLVATLGITCLAQESQSVPAGDNSGLRIAENPKIELKNNLTLTPQIEDNSNVPLDLQSQPGYSAYTIKRAGKPDLTVWIPDTPTVGCYSLRIYHFERDDTESPELTGETTCTQMSKRAFKRVMPEARLVPAN